MAVPVYIPTHSVGGFPFLHTFSIIYYLQPCRLVWSDTSLLYLLFSQSVSFKYLILQILCEERKILYSNWCGKGYELNLDIFMTHSGKLDTSCCKETCLTLFITPPRTSQNLFDQGLSFYVKIKILTLILLPLSTADILRSLMLWNDKWPQFFIPPCSYALCHVTLGYTSTLTLNLAVWLGPWDVS